MKRISTLHCKEDVLQGLTALRAGSTLVVFDTETTGLSAKNDKILSFSAKRIAMEEGVIRTLEEFEVWIKNGPVPPEITEINGITDEMLEDGLFEDEAMEIIHAYLEDEPFLVSYNGQFDIRFLNEAYMRTFGEPFKYAVNIDVLQMAKESLELEKYKLGHVAHELGVDRDITFHRSMDDVEATLRVFKLLIPYYTKRGAEAEDVENVCTYVKVVKALYYEHPLNHRVKRVYVYTSNKTKKKTFYDLYRSEWRTEREELDLNDVRQQVLRKYRVKDEKELVKKLKEEK